MDGGDRQAGRGPEPAAEGAPAPLRARDNPFAVQRLDRLAFRLPPGESWAALLARFAALDHRAAIVGSEGRGKTTLLGELTARLEARGFRARRLDLSGLAAPRRGRRAAARRRLSLPPSRLRSLAGSLAVRDLLVVDGADLLTPRDWRRLRRRSRAAGGLLVTSHRPGLLPTLIECSTSPDLLGEILRQLLNGPGGGSRGGEIAADLPPVEALFERHLGNLRDALRELYDHCAGR